MKLNVWVNGVDICRNQLLCSAFWMTKVSFTYPSQKLGGWAVELLALVINSYMNMLATMGQMGDLMAAPFTCS